MSEQNSWDAYNELMLRGALDRFTKLFARYELFKRVIDIPGDIVEGGVFKGAGVLFWAKLIQIFNPLSGRKVVGFDTFGGYPETTGENDKKAGETFIQASHYSGISPEEIMKIAASQDLDRRIELIKGDAGATIKDYVKSNPGFRIALLNLDFDSYVPTVSALQHLYPRVVPAGAIVFDDYSLTKWGESDAVDEFFNDKHVVYHSLPWAFSPTAYIIKEP